MRFLFWRRKRDEELDEEIQSHLRMAARDRVERGEDAKEAEQSAKREMGNVALVAETTRDIWGWRWLADFAQDIRFGLRMLSRNPGFTAVAVLTLAFGIGANTAIFSLIEAAILRNLPVKDPQQLVLLSNINEDQAINAFSYPQFTYMRQYGQSSNIFAYTDTKLNLNAGDVTEEASGLLVSEDYFSELGVRPFLGRLIVSGDESVAVLSHRFWVGRFGGDRTIVGKAATLNGLPFTIVGIAPKQFFGTEEGSSPDMYVPLVMRDRLSPGEPMLPARNNFWLTVMGRLRPGMKADQARAEFGVLYQQANLEQTRGLPGESPLVRYFRGISITVIPGDRGPGGLRDNFRRPLLILMTIVGLVLLIACANVASLLLARATARQKEMGVRIALGAGRARLLRQFLTEGLLLSTSGGLLGLVIAWWLADGLIGILMRTTLSVSPDATVFAFTLSVTILTGLLFGAAPAFRATRFDPISSLRSEYGIGRLRNWGGRSVLVTGQVAISLFLLIGAGLFIRTLMNLRNLDMGFRGDHVLLMSVNPGLSRYTTDRTDNFYTALLERVKAVPGVQSASIADQPLLGGAMFDGLTVEDHATIPGQPPTVAVKSVTPGFFETMGIVIRGGRDFTKEDRRGTQKVAIINERVARQFFDGQNPIGKHIGVGSLTPDLEIVGVIADTKYRSLRNPAPRTVYLPFSQLKSPSPARTLHIRSHGEPSRMASAIRDQVREIDKNLPVTDLKIFAELVDENLVQERLIASISGFFGTLAVLLACMGLYGVMSYAVTCRTREIGIRMALGASRIRILEKILRESLGFVLIGTVIGISAALASMRLIQSQLFGVKTADPLTIVVATFLMVAVATIAGFLPARHASKVDPMVALRQE